jgi:hypothetical protein
MNEGPCKENSVPQETFETITSGLCSMNTIYETGVPTDDTHLQQVTPTS